MMRGKRKRDSPWGNRLVGSSKRMISMREYGVFLPCYGVIDQWEDAANSNVNEDSLFGRNSFSFGKRTVSAYLIRILEIGMNSNCHGRRRGES